MISLDAQRSKRRIKQMKAEGRIAEASFYECHFNKRQSTAKVNNKVIEEDEDFNPSSQDNICSQYCDLQLAEPSLRNRNNSIISSLKEKRFQRKSSKLQRECSKSNEREESPSAGLSFRSAHNPSTQHQLTTYFMPAINSKLYTTIKHKYSEVQDRFTDAITPAKNQDKKSIDYIRSISKKRFDLARRNQLLDHMFSRSHSRGNHEENLSSQRCESQSERYQDDWKRTFSKVTNLELKWSCQKKERSISPPPNNNLEYFYTKSTVYDQNLTIQANPKNYISRSPNLLKKSKKSQQVLQPKELHQSQIESKTNEGPVPLSREFSNSCLHKKPKAIRQMGSHELLPCNRTKMSQESRNSRLRESVTYSYLSKQTDQHKLYNITLENKNFITHKHENSKKLSRNMFQRSPQNVYNDSSISWLEQQQDAGTSNNIGNVAEPQYGYEKMKSQFALINDLNEKKKSGEKSNQHSQSRHSLSEKLQEIKAMIESKKLEQRKQSPEVSLKDSFFTQQQEHKGSSAKEQDHQQREPGIQKIRNSKFMNCFDVMNIKPQMEGSKRYQFIIAERSVVDKKQTLQRLNEQIKYSNQYLRSFSSMDQSMQSGEEEGSRRHYQSKRFNQKVLITTKKLQ